MGNDPADDDDEWWDNSKFRRGRVGAWNPKYLRKFTTLLQQNTVLFQTAQKYPKNDPIHELRAKALEHVQKELGMTDVELKQKMVTFRKFAANKLKQIAEKCGPQARPETILKAAPGWLRAIEPHLSLWTQIRNARALAEKAATEKPPAEPDPAPATDAAEVESPGTRLAFVLVQNARELRSLDADVVCKLDCVPADKAQETKYVWWRMLHVVTQKLNFQRDGSDAIPAAKLSPVESLLADLLLLLEPNISTLPESNDYESVQHLVTLFHLAQLHKLENSDPGLASRWRRAHQAYLTRTPQISGVCCGIIMMQRRWHELKSAARRAMVQYSRRQAPPCPLHAAIVKRFPHVVTEPLSTWQELVASGQVIDAKQEGNPNLASSEAEADELEAELEGVSLLSPEDLHILKPYHRSAKEEEDDLVLIEKEIETIDLINMDERDNELEQRAAQKKKVADALASELDRQLKDIQKHSGASEMVLLSKPCGEPTYIYDSDSDVECTEDRNRNIDLIARQIILEGSPVVKKEPDSDDALDVIVEDDDAVTVNVDDDDDDDCTEIDGKLLMDTRITLLRVDSTPEWKRVAKRPRIDLKQLNLDRFAAKKPRLESPGLAGSNNAIIMALDPTVKVKVEKIKEESTDDSAKPKGERQVKSMAKRLISEIMREETEDQTSDKSKVTKKVQLPNIDEVRKNNLSMLTAQVAPLASGEGAPLPKEGAPLARVGAPLAERRPSADSDGELHIDETNIEQIPEDVTLSQNELQNVLEKLAVERRAARPSRPLGVSSHSAYCCTARRQNALNAARRRLAARSGRVAPPYMEIHSTSACATKKKCVCCCKHLLELVERGARLERETLEVDVALRRLLGVDANDTAGTSNATKKHSKKKKKTQDEQESDVDKTQSQQNDPLKEWIRQKSLNEKYFNLNLNRPEKPKSESQNKVVKITPKPDNAEIFTNVVKKTNLRNNPHLLPSEKGGKNLYTIIHSPIGSLSSNTGQSPTTNQSPSTTQSASTSQSPSTSQPASTSQSAITSQLANTSLMGSVTNVMSRTPNNQTLRKVSVPYYQKNITLATKLVEGDNSPKKLVKISLPAFAPGKVIHLYKENGDSNAKKTVIHPGSPGVQTSLGKIITNADQKKMLVLSPSDKRKLTLAAVPSLQSIGNTSTNSPQLSTAKGKIVIDSSENETQEKTPDKPTPYQILQGKLQTNSAGFQIFPSSAGKLARTSILPASKIGAVGSLRGQQDACIISVKSLNSSLQGKVATNLKQGMATISSLPGKMSTPQITLNQGKTTGNQVKLLNSLFEKQGTPTITRIIRKPKTNFSFTSITSPVKIAPKPDNIKDVGGNDDADGVGEPAEQSVQPRGTGMKISKISSFTQPAESRSLLRSEDRPGPSVKPGIIIKPGTAVKPSTSVTSALSVKPGIIIKPSVEPGTAVKPDTLIKSGTSVAPGTSGKPGPSGSSGLKKRRLVILDKDGTTRELLMEMDQEGTIPTTKAMLIPEFKLETHFKRTDYTLSLEKYLLNKDPTNLTVIVFDDKSDYLTVRSADDQYLVLTEADLGFTSPAYWSLVPAKFSARIKFDKKITVKSVAELNSMNVVMASPDKMLLDKQVYLKLKDDPLIYAKALFVIRTPAECNSELLRNSKLHMLNMKGTLTSVQRSYELGIDQFALSSPNVFAARALAEVLNGLPDVPATPTDTNPPVKSDVNARADVVMMMNNVNRKPIEMVYVDSEDEDVVKKEFDFKGLEKFEDLDDFDL